MSDLEAYLLRSAGMHKSAMSITAPPPPIAVSEGIQPINSLPMPTAVSTTTKKKRKPYFGKDAHNAVVSYQNTDSRSYQNIDSRDMSTNVNAVDNRNINETTARTFCF